MDALGIKLSPRRGGVKLSPRRAKRDVESDDESTSSSSSSSSSGSSSSGSSSSSSSGSSTSSSSVHTPEPPPPPVWLEFEKDGAEPCRWWWHRVTGELKWIKPYRTVTLRIPRKDMMRDHGTPEMGSWSYLAREARKRAAQRKKRHLRNAVTYGDQGKWHRAVVEVDKARLAHDGDADRFYNALLAARLHHAAWALHCNEKRSSAALACNLFERWREGTSVEAPSIHIMLKYEIACSAAGRPAVEERGTQHAVSLTQRRDQAFDLFAELLPEEEVIIEDHKPKLLDDPASKAWAQMRTKTQAAKVKKHTALERLVEHHSLLWCASLLQEGGGLGDERALDCLEQIYEDQSRRAAANYVPEELEEDDLGGLPPGLEVPPQLPRWLATLLYSRALAHANRGFEARAALEDARALASNDAVDPIASLEAPPDKTRGQSAEAWLGDTRVWITANEVLRQRRQPFLALQCTETALETLELKDVNLGSLNNLPKSQARHRAECEIWWRRAEGLWVCHHDREAFRALQRALKVEPWHLDVRLTARKWEIEAREQGAFKRMEAYEKLEEAQKTFFEVKLEAHKQEQMELMRKAQEALASVAVLGEPFDRLQWKQVDSIFQHLNAVERACIAVALPCTRRAGCAFLLRAEEYALVRYPQALARGMLARVKCNQLMREWKAYQAWEAEAFGKLSNTIRMTMAKGPPRYFLGWRAYTREQKKYRVYVATKAANAVRRRLAQLRTERRRKHNRILKADRPRFVKRQLGRGMNIFKKTLVLVHFRRDHATTIQRRARGMRGRRKVWVEKLLKHHSQRRLKRLYWKWGRYSQWCKKRRLASECIQRFIRSFLSRCHCRTWLRRRKRNNIASNRMRIRLQRRDHRIIVRAWDKDAKAIILARRIKMSTRIARWYRNRRVYWRAKVLRLRRIRVRAEQKALTESLAIASIYSLQKNARSKVIQRMWRAYAAKHCLKRLKKQRQKAKKLRRKFFKRQGRWCMAAWREMHRKHMRCAHVIIRAFRRYIALTCVRRLRKAQRMVTSKVAFALVKKGQRTCIRIMAAWHTYARQSFAARVCNGRARCWLAKRRLENAQKLRNQERMKIALGVGRRELRTRIKVFVAWKTWAPQSRAANTIVRMCRCRIARDECRELARQKRENDAKIRACIGAKEYRIQKKWWGRCKQIWLWESRSRRIALFVKGIWALRHYRELARIKREQNAKIRRCIGSKEDRTKIRMWRGFKTLFIWRKQREAAQRAVDKADALLAALAYDKAYRSMKARAANWLCGRMVMLLARSAAARRRVADRHLKKRQRALMLDFRRRQRRVYLSKFTDLLAAKGVAQIRGLFPPKPKKSFTGGLFSKKREKKAEVVEEEEAAPPPPKMLRYAPLSITVEKGENLVAKDWSFRKANRTSDPYVVVKLDGKEVGKTLVVDKSLSPVWSFSLETEVREEHLSQASLEFEIRDKDLVGSDAMGSVQLDSKDFGEAAWYDVAKTKDCKDASGRLFVGCRVGAIVERAKDVPPPKKKKKSWFGSSKKKEKAAPVATKKAEVETPADEVPVAQQPMEDDSIDLPAMPAATSASRAHRSKEGLSARYFEARRRVSKCGVLAWRSNDLGRGELVALASSADAVVLEAPFYGSEDVLLAAAALLAPATPAALTARRSGKMKMLRSSRPPKLVLAGEARDLYLDRKAGAACGLLAARGRAAAVCIHRARCSVGFGKALARGLVRKDLDTDSLRELALDGACLGPGALACLLESIMLRTSERQAKPLTRLVLDGNSFNAPTLVGQLKALIGGPACPSNLSLAQCRLQGYSAYVIAAGLDAHNNVNQSEEPLSLLRISVERAENLVVKDWALTAKNRSSDPYVVVKVDGKKVGKTQVIKKNLNPEWNFTVECEVQAPQSSVIELKIWDKDLATSDSMGAVVLKDLQRGEEPVLEWYDVECTKDCKDASGRLCCGAAWSKPERPPTPPSQKLRRHLEVLVLKDNPDLGDRGCAALAKAAAATPTLSRLDLARCGCGPQTGFALADELCFQFSVEKPKAWLGVRAPGADVEVIDTKPRAPPPDPRPHLSVGLSRNFDLGNDAINRLAFVAERSKYRLGVECSSDLYGDEAGLMLAGLPAKDRRFVISSKTVVAAPAPAPAPAPPEGPPVDLMHKARWTKADYALMTLENDSVTYDLSRPSQVSRPSFDHSAASAGS